MKTTPTFTIGKNEVNVTVEWPDKVAAFIESEPRILALFVGFGTAHWVQSKIKAAYAAEKPSDEQKELMRKVENGVTLDGETFIPRERGTAPKKDDAFCAEFRKRFDTLTPEKLAAFAERWKMGEHDGKVDTFIEAYWTEKLRQIKEAADAANALLD